MARHYARRTEELRQLRGALSLLETEIAYGATPLYLACRHIGEQETGAGRALFLPRIPELNSIGRPFRSRVLAAGPFRSEG